jgi:predicted CopG family antitoxin
MDNIKPPIYKQITVSEENHETLRGLKIHPRESFNDVITRILEKIGVIKNETK